MLKLILLAMLFVHSIANVSANVTFSEWTDISEIEAVTLIGKIASPSNRREEWSFPDKINLMTLSGERGFLGREAWIFKQDNCSRDYEQDVVSYLKKSEGIDESKICDHFFLTEDSQRIHYEKHKASYFRFSTTMKIRVSKKDGELRKIELLNDSNKKLTIDIKNDDFRYTYEFKNKTYSFKANKDQDGDFLFNLGNILAYPLIILIGAGC